MHSLVRILVSLNSEVQNSELKHTHSHSDTHLGPKQGQYKPWSEVPRNHFRYLFLIRKSLEHEQKSASF